MTSPQWLSEAEQSAWRSYLAMHTQLMAELHRQLQDDAGLSLTDFEVLVRLTDQADGRVRVGELAQMLAWEKSRLSHHLARMQRRGLVTREDCPEDARGSFTVLTPAGREAIEQAAPCHVSTVRELFFNHLTGQDVQQLHDIADRVRAYLDHTR